MDLNYVQLDANPVFIYLTISTFTSVRSYDVGVGVGVGVRRPGVPLPSFKFLQSYHKVSLIIVA